MISKWEAQNILTRSISYDISGVAIHICNMVIELQPKTMLKTGPANLLLGKNRYVNNGDNINTPKHLSAKYT